MTTNTLRAGLPPLPARMSNLPIDERGYPVPFFVAWVDGKPDHRVMDSAKLPLALKSSLCWLCGNPLGAYKSFVIGPMCAITRTISEPPSHLDCCRYAAITCPFLTRPLAKRREANLPDKIRDSAGVGLKRNPGAVCVWTTKAFRPFRVPNGILFDIGEPHSTEWYSQGRAATRSEVDDSIVTGIHHLQAVADEEGPAAVADLERRLAGVRAMLDQVLPHPAEGAAS